MASKIDEIRQAAEASLEVFINLVHPQRLLGHCHKEVIKWWEREDAKQHQLLLFPRDHMKSALVAYRCAHRITKNPATRILYISSTANLAEKQLQFIKDILTSDVYRRYWPEMVHPDEGKRTKWTSTEISVDHPNRRAEYIRDPTVFTGGLTTNMVGMHCDIAVLDDVVTGDNAYTDEGREKVKRQYSLLASIEGADAEEWVVGTRYHPVDLYSEMLDMKSDIFNKYGDLEGEEEVYEIFERPVEDMGDGSGQFLWPRQQRVDGKWFGFDQRVLATKRAKYRDKTQFRSQYYNNPNDSESAAIQREYFQYYNKKLIKNQDSGLFYNGQKLNVFASVDFASSTTKKADFSSIAVVGIDSSSNYYVLEIARFKTPRVKDIFDRILELHNRWGFHKIRADATAAQAMIVVELREQYIRKHGLALSIEEFKANRHMGTKEERISATLVPRYENHAIWHYTGGFCELLEEELVLQNPPHDDMKDALANAISICVPPTGYQHFQSVRPWEGMVNSRFGGIS